MKRSIFYIFVLIFTQAGFGQTVFENFDFYNIQTKYIINTPEVTSNSSITLLRQPVDNYENDNALGVKYSIWAESGGDSNAMVEFINPDTSNGGVWDFAGYQSISFAINNKIKCSKPSQVDLSIILFDISDAPLNTKNMNDAEFWESFQYVLDLEPGWNTYDVPLIPVSKNFIQEKPNSGFWHSDQEGVPGNNKLDLDKIAGIGLEFYRSSLEDGTIAEGEILIDNIFLNGKTSALAVFNTESANPGSFHLNQNYPNPFNPSTRISFNMTQQDNIKLSVYDILGKEIAVLINRNMMPGEHNVVFDAGNLPSGFYLYRLQVGEFTQIKKMMLVK
jgi:hypothetical protein